MIRPILAAVGIGLCLTAASPAYERRITANCIVQVCVSWMWMEYNGVRAEKCERYESRINSKCLNKVPNSDLDWPPPGHPGSHRVPRP